MSSIPRTLIASLLALVLVACSSDGENTETTTTATTETTAGATVETTTTADNGRVFDSTDDAVITALEAALASNNASAEWDGSEIVITLDGSTEDPTAWLPCTAALGLIATDETARLVYADGELACAERPGYGG